MKIKLLETSDAVRKGFHVVYRLDNDDYEEEDISEKEKNKTDYPEEGNFAELFNKEDPDDKLTFTITAKDFLELIIREMPTSNALAWRDYGYSFSSNYLTNSYEVFESERISNNSILAKLLSHYKSSDKPISEDLEHKLIWLYPPFAEAIGLDKISYGGKLLYLYKRPHGIKYFDESTAEMQLIAIRESWQLITAINKPCKEALDNAAKCAIRYYKARATELRNQGIDRLMESESDTMKKDYDFFSAHDFDPIIKEDILGAIMSIVLEHEMDSFM